MKKLDRPGAWDAEDCWEPIIGGPALHSVSGENEVKVIRSRPIGFGANIDAKPVYRVPARSRKT